MSWWRRDDQPPVEALIDEIRAETRMVAREIGTDRLDERVYDALRAVPRERFVPPELEGQAYDNRPLPIGHGQTISQPFIVALMTHLLRPQPSDVVLEVGLGCGYQAAVLSRLVHAVYSADIVAPLVESARERLDALGYRNVHTRCADGYYGWEEQAPFDGILVTAATPRVPPSLVEQLKPGARLVLPLGTPYGHQELVTVMRDESGATELRPILPVAFVPLTGGPHDEPRPGVEALNSDNEKRG